MNASSFITFFTYMLRQNVIPFWKELFVAFKMAPNIKTYSLYFSSYIPLYKGHSCILKVFEAKYNARFGTRADIVSKGAKIRNRYNQVPHLTQDTNGKVTNSQKTPQTRAKRSALSQQVTTKHI